MAKDAVKITLKHERDTKGTRVYKTDDDQALITQVYLTKSGGADKFGDSITVTVEGS